MSNSNSSTTPDSVQTIVIGAGVVGLAVARALALAGHEVMVLEQHAAIGTETSARNSEVIHAGLYYPTGSLKAALCVRGNAMLYDYAARKQVPHRRIGKLIVASHAQQLPAMHALHQQATANGVPDIKTLTSAQAQTLEPQLHCFAALHSGSTGIIDSHAYMLALQGDLEAAGGAVVCHARLTAIEIAPTQNGFLLHVSTPDGPVQLRTQHLINCAGLHAAQVASTLAALPARYVPKPYFAKGSYFSLSAPSPFKRLIYPMHTAAGLGVHLTLDLGGQARFGPDVEWLNIEHAPQIDYAVQPSKAQDFYTAIRQYWPALPDDALLAAYSGVRPKIAPPNAAAADFLISSAHEHGIAGLVNLFGIESPGLTASLALAERVIACLNEAKN